MNLLIRQQTVVKKEWQTVDEQHKDHTQTQSRNITHCCWSQRALLKTKACKVFPEQDDF